MGILEDFYYGQATPMEMVPYSYTPKERRVLANEKDEYIKKLQLQLTEEQAELLDKIMEKKVALNAMSCRDSFITGWKLGVKFMIETLQD